MNHGTWNKLGNTSYVFYTPSFVFHENMWLLVLQRIAIEFVLDIVYFPLWWYTGGVKWAFLYCLHFFKSANSYLAPGLWLNNIFVPMYAQTDIQGRLVSFIVRLGNVIIRGIGLLIWLVITLFLFSLWLLVPLLVVYMLLVSLDLV